MTAQEARAKYPTCYVAVLYINAFTAEPGGAECLRDLIDAGMTPDELIRFILKGAPAQLKQIATEHFHSPEFRRYFAGVLGLV